MDKPPFPIIAAHTGCNGTPYNTIESFFEGIRSGADIVEIDLRVIKDGTVILLHDDCPYIHECTFEQLNQLDVRTKVSPIYERNEIVRLTDILQLAKQYPVKLNLDIKTTATIEPVIQLVKQHDAVEQIFITGCSESITINHPDIQVVLNTPTRLTPEEKANYLLFANKVCNDGTHGSYYGLNMQYETCRPELVELAHERGLAVWVYTVNDPEAMCRMVDSKVDAMTTKKVTELVEMKRNKISLSPILPEERK
jgi:glycerophosphoryl diester phosphodiesterase